MTLIVSLQTDNMTVINNSRDGQHSELNSSAA